MIGNINELINYDKTSKGTINLCLLNFGLYYQGYLLLIVYIIIV